MGKHTPRTAATAEWWTLRGIEQTFADDLLRSGFKSDNDLDTIVGLHEADPLTEGRMLLAQREQFGLSAEDIAELLAAGWLNRDEHGFDEAGLLFVLDAGRLCGKHRSDGCN